ncbi:unnamed protein product [Porites lobata]|uniref:Reverse transcriptase domain-containing protein n=1 Tax=Porites lobata TaxID=104759 RepID=A0ABN8NVZ5_9CNID|nr:unnamed protein product [Porites lobata]
MLELWKLKLEELPFDIAVAKYIAMERSDKDVEALQGDKKSIPANLLSKSRPCEKPKPKKEAKPSKKKGFSSPKDKDSDDGDSDHYLGSLEVNNVGDKDHYKERGHVKLAKSHITLKTSTEQKITPEEEMKCNVKFKGQEKELTLQVVETPGPALFGRDWLSKIQLDWGEIKALKLSQTPEGVMQQKVDQLLQQYETRRTEKHFSKLDRRKAYHQLEVTEEYKKFLTINIR